MEVKDVQERFKLTRNYISECLKHLDFAFLGHYSRGQNNRLIFDSSAFQIFERITNEKALGKTLPQIKAILEKEAGNHKQLAGNDRGSTPTTASNSEGKPAVDPMLDALKEAHRIAIEAKDKQIEDNERRADETITSQRETITSLKNELLSLPDGRSPREIKEAWEKQRKHTSQRQELLAELEVLQNRLFFNKTKRQKAILTELKELESEW